MPVTRTSFAKGNMAAAVHGAYGRGPSSRALIAARADRIRARLDEQYGPELVKHVLDRPLFEDWVWAVAQCELLQEFLDRTSSGSLIDTRGRVRKCADLYLKVRRYKSEIQRELLMSPMARSQSVGHALQSEGLAAQLARRQLQRTQIAVVDGDSSEAK